MMTIGTRIRALRDEQGLSRSDLCIKARVAYENIANWEVGRTVPSDMEALVRIAHVLGTTAEDLVGGAEDSFAREDVARYGADS